ncbi:MAG: efflux RND transporter periplasmic adaptor subunit [Rhodospirillaceae bacterium]|nr:efflux RND transporter periplasmic adaptor subunit [Rhodospirillaceae bacterium]
MNPNPTRKRMIIMLVVVLGFLGLVFGFKIFMGGFVKKMISGNIPVQTVSTTVAKAEDWQPSLSAVGSLRAVRGADLAFEVSGIVDEIDFNSGDEVKAGTVLARLRSEDDQARLASLQAAADLANITLARDRKQLEAKAISQAALDAAASNAKTSQAAVAEARATLNKKTIRAPFDGKVGVRLVDVGQYLNPGTAVVTLQSLDPIYADFYMPPQQASQLAVAQKAMVRLDADADTHLDGEISAINPKVETSSRNVLVRATLHNPGSKLLPGTSVNIEVNSGKPSRYITIPQTAVTFNPYGNTVYLAVEQKDDKGQVVKDEKGQPKLVARQAFVVTGPTRGDQVAVFEGIKEGDTIVTAGQLKIQNGTLLAVNNSVQPANNPKPKPVDE